jgi:biotin carboxyl carrier protein
MHLEVKSGSRTAKIEILRQDGSFYHVRIDNREYKLDVERVSDVIYSILYHGKSINMEMITGEKINSYKVNTIKNYYEIEVIDARTRYLLNAKGELEHNDNIISSPMPGKIVKIPVNEGDQVEKGQTLVVVSAMKMESEYKSRVNGTIKHIFVAEGSTIDGHQPLLEITPANNQ